jgi:hypothetical protein
MRLGNVRVHTHGRRREHAQTPPAKVADLDALERDDRLVLVVESLGLLAPQGETNALARLVDELNIPLGELFCLQ